MNVGDLFSWSLRTDQTIARGSWRAWAWTR